MKKKIISIMLIATMCASSITACGKIPSTDEVQLTEHEQNSTTKSSEKLEAKSDYKDYFDNIDKLDINGVEANISMTIAKKDKNATDTRLDTFTKYISDSYGDFKPEDITISLAQTFKGENTDNGLKLYCKIKDREIGLFKTTDELYLLNTFGDKNIHGKINISDFISEATTNQETNVADEIKATSTTFSDFLKSTGTYNGKYTYKKTIKDGDKTLDMLRASNDTMAYEIYINQETNLPDKLVVTSETDKDFMNIVCDLTYEDSITVDNENNYTDMVYDDSKQNVNSIIGNMYFLLLLFQNSTYSN